ncbi:MAG: hypothetical protein GWN58_34435, partial [Anaerolineae bacterium]|nr:hypothetical protein [Thermoplasmata archaeon]NIV34377.1 hypothetical protein [Anaerolineae bacterium]NIY06286.1 hypothetical protein [Thermoplasmata archaeon]
DELIEGGDEAAAAQKEVLEANRKLTSDTLAKELKAYEKEMKAIQRELGALPDSSDLSNLITEMWEDYNRTYIVPRWRGHKDWAQIYNKEKGIIDWEYLQKARPKKGKTAAQKREFFAEVVQEQAEQAGIGNLEKLYRTLNSVPGQQMALNVPLSPL